MTIPNFARPVAAPSRQPRTYQLDPSVIEQIGALANDLGVWPSSLVNMLLLRALGEVEAGRWQMGAEPAAYRAVWRE